MSYGPHGSRIQRCKAAYIAVAVILLLFLVIYSPLPETYDGQRHNYLQQLAETARERLVQNLPTAVTVPNRPSLNTTNSKYAFATFLATDSIHEDDPEADHDKYFVATRILTYQLLHAPETKSVSDVPFIVLVTPEVTEEKRERLRNDGAIVWQADYVHSNWLKTDIVTWQDVLMKLRLWELTQFERVCFVDGDTVLTRPLDGVFDDHAVKLQTTNKTPQGLRDDEAPLPATYSFASVPEMKHEHSYPPTEDGHDFPNINYLNAGFFVLKPSTELFKYYESLLQLKERFNPHMPEQNLLNYAHRREGNAPWRQLNNTWNIHYPSPDDLNGGVASLHEKWWAPVYQELLPFLQSWRWRMEGFYEARDALLRQADREETLK